MMSVGKEKDEQERGGHDSLFTLVCVPGCGAHPSKILHFPSIFNVGPLNSEQCGIENSKNAKRTLKNIILYTVRVQ